MNKLKILIVSLVVFIFCGLIDVNAASATLSVSSNQVYVGDNFKVFVNINESAAWNIQVNSSGPVSGCVINEADTTKDALNTSKQLSANCTATQEGTISIRLSGDVTSATDGNYMNVSGSKIVNVIVKPKPTASPANPIPSNPTPSNPTQNNPTPSNPTQNPTEEDNRSTNAGLSSLTINGKKTTPVDNVYQLEVGNYLENIEIAAKTEDDKATLSGTGSKNIKVGENSFEILVTAEKGNTTTYTVKIIRKEYNSLSDLDEILKLKRDTEIKLNDNDNLSEEQLEKISKSKNIITLTKLSKDNKVLYSWILDGSKLKSVKEFNPNIIPSENNNDIEEAMNYADGIYLDFSKCKDIPKGTILRYYVSDKYKDGDKVDLYAYNSNKVTQIKENIIVKDGYIEFEVTDEVKHVITKAKVLNAETDELNIWYIISMILIAVIIVILLFIIINKIKNKKKELTTSNVTSNSELANLNSNDANNNII